LVLDGTAVLNFSIARVAARDKAALRFLRTLSLEEIDYFVLHQANRMINETIRKKLGLAAERVPSTLHDFGNTSSASIPLTMTAGCETFSKTSAATLLLSGFGIGYRGEAACFVPKVSSCLRCLSCEYGSLHLEGKRILVTGASSGLGREIARGCALRGARLVVSGGTRLGFAKPSRAFRERSMSRLVRTWLILPSASGWRKLGHSGRSSCTVQESRA
jgi:hypothetical protein